MKKIFIALSLFALPAFAQQAQQDPTIQAIYERYQRADSEAIQLRAALIKAEREIAELKAKGEQKPPSDAIGVPSPGGGVQMKMQEPKK